MPDSNWKCMKDLWDYIDEGFDSDLASRDIVRTGDVFKLLNKGKLKTKDVIDILITSGKAAADKRKQLTDLVAKRFKRFKHLAKHLSENKLAIPALLLATVVDVKPPSSSSPIAPSSSCVQAPSPTKRVQDTDKSVWSKSCTSPISSSNLSPSPTKRLKSHPIACSSPISPVSHRPPQTSFIPAITSPPAPLHLRARRNRANCFECKMKNARIKNLVERNRRLIASKREKIAQLNMSHRADRKRNSVKVPNQSIRRKSSKIEELKENLKGEQKQKSALERIKDKLMTKPKPTPSPEFLEKQNKKLQDKVSALEMEVKSLKFKARKEETENKEAIEDLRQQLQEAHCTSFTAKKNQKQYTNEVRLLIFRFLLENCPVEGISNLIKSCAEVKIFFLNNALLLHFGPLLDYKVDDNPFKTF